MTTFYVSNVEHYLFQQGDDARRYYENAAALPIDGTSTFIRSFSGGRFSFDRDPALKPQSAFGRSLQLYSSVDHTLRAFAAGTVTSWLDVVWLSRQ